MKNVFFNSSMPRSGSTLLQNILMQNPEIYSTPTDGFLELLFAARVNYTEMKEFKAQDNEIIDKAWKGFCWGGLQGYANGLTDRPNVCLKSRGIGIHYNFFKYFYEDRPMKVLCCVRDLRAIFSSMEKIFRSQQHTHQSLQNHATMTGTTTFKRVLSLANSPPIGLALERFNQMILDKTIDHCHIIRYEDICNKPQETFHKIYKYLELPYFEHDFEKLEQFTVEDDSVHGISNLHTIKNTLEESKPDWYDILGRDTSLWINQNISWYQNYFGYSK